MKNLNTQFLKITAITIITLFMSSTVFAQVQQDTSARDTSNQQQTRPQEQNQRTDSKDYDKGVDYSETIDKNELPQEVNSSLEELYPAHDISEVFKGEDDSFKVKVKNETDEAVVYYSSEGDFLRAENLTGLQQEGTLPQEQGQRTKESQWGTDDRKNQQGSQMGTGTDNQRKDQKSGQGTMGNRTEDKDDRSARTEKNQQGTAGTYGNERSQQQSQSGTMRNENSRYSQDQSQRTDDRMRSQDSDQGVDYSETIEKNELPEEVTSSLDKLYPAHEIEEIHRGDNDSYKVKVKNEDDVAVVYYDSEGSFLRANNLSGLQQEGALPQGQSQRTQESQNQWGPDSRTNQQKSQMDKGTHNQDMHRGTGHGTMEKESGDRDDHRSTKTESNKQGTTGTYGADRSQSQRGTMNNESSSYPQEQRQKGMHDDRMGSMDFDKGVEYSETVKESELPKEVTRSLDEKYPAHEIEEIQLGDDDSYKVKVKNEDDVAFIYFDSEGKFLRANNMNDTSYGKSPQQKSHRMSETQDKNQWSSENRGNTEGTSATPQEQSQRTQEQDDLAMQGERRTDSEWGADNQSGTRANRSGSKSERTDNQYGVTETDTTGTKNKQGKVSPQEQSQVTGDDNKQYTEEIRENDLPELITNSVQELYPDYDVKKAYRANDGSYKVKIENQDDEVALFYDSSGYFVRDEKMNLNNKTKNTNEDW